jgi:hypothetical protein
MLPASDAMDDVAANEEAARALEGRIKIKMWPLSGAHPPRY